jgi:DNA-binding transcriptional LysR family regulator
MMSQLEELTIFIRVAESGGIGKAAEQLGIAKSAVSRRLADLEKRLGATLINRTTRTLSLSEAGLRCYEHAIRVVDVVSELNASVTQEEHDINGLIRLSVPRSFATNHMVPIMDEFLGRHPGIRINMDVSDQFIDIVAQGLDLALRIGELKDSTLKARRLSPIDIAMLATPEYLAAHGHPTTIEQLLEHSFLLHASAVINPLKLTAPNGESHTLTLKSKFSINDGDLLQQFALLGHGILVSPTFIAWKEIQSGQLIRLLPDFATSNRYLHAVYPNTRFLPKRVRLFIDFLAERFDETPYWDAPHS